jgi:hypothetical protein
LLVVSTHAASPVARFGKWLVLMDFTGGINKYRFALGCILVRDDRGRGFGGAFCITSTESVETVSKFVEW